MMLATASSQSDNCASFWPTIPPGSHETVDHPCHTSSILENTGKGTFAYYDEWQNDRRLDQLAEVVGQAFTAATRWFAELEPNTADVVIILTNEADDTADARTYRPLNTTGACQILLFQSWYDESVTDDYRLQVLAHELYHSVQYSLFGNGHFPAPWWVEGTAEYFSNLVYPSNNVEWKTARNYVGEIALFVNDAHSTNIFFQSMANQPSKGPVGVHNWVKSQGSIGDPAPAVERKRLANFPSMVDDFHLFGQQFALKQVWDSDGYEKVPEDNDVIKVPLPLSSGSPLVDSTVATAFPSAAPFTVSVFTITIDGGQTVTLEYATALTNVRMAYKLPDATVWTVLPTANDILSSGAEGTVIVPCNHGTESVVIELLFTSTDDIDNAAATVTITQVAEDQTCVCEGPNSSGNRRWLEQRGLERCPSSSSASLSSTPTQSSTVSSAPSSSPSATTSSSLSTTASSITSGCTSVSSQPTNDPCLSGPTWTLDIPSIKSLMRQRLASDPRTTINSLSVSGSGTLMVSGQNATFTYTDFTVDLDISAEGFDVPTHTVVNGAFDANLYLQAADLFCLDVYAGQGSAVETDPITGGFTFDLGPDGGFVDQKYRIGYTCTPGMLSMQGTYDGKVAWGPYAFTS